jgi:CRP/FNR family transcriptional regulator, anaerobic regulatory protein
MNAIAGQMQKTIPLVALPSTANRLDETSGSRAAAGFRIRCSSCPQNSYCLPPDLGAEDIAGLEAVVEHGAVRHKGDHIFRQGEEFVALHVVRSGSVASYSSSASGCEQITGFSFPGSVLGMDGIAINRHRTSAVALETTSVCRIPYESVRALGQRVPALQHHVFRRLSQEIAAEQRLLSTLGKCSAEQRVANLLLDISGDLKRRHLSALRFDLPMTRRDIGNFLGISTETVSRSLTQLQRDGILRVDSRQITIRDPDRLRVFAGGGNS